MEQNIGSDAEQRAGSMLWVTDMSKLIEEIGHRASRLWKSDVKDLEEKIVCINSVCGPITKTYECVYKLERRPAQVEG